jgi:hypothetical protein
VIDQSTSMSHHLPVRLARRSKRLAERNKSLGPGQATKKQNHQ